jgi:GH18 family chitinase
MNACLHFSRRRFLGTIAVATPLLAPITGEAAGEGDTMQVSGYLPDYRLAGFQAERCRLLTDLVCFSIQLEASGQLDAAAAAIKVSGFKKLAENSKLPVHLCIGGWERSAGFLKASATAASRHQLGQQLVQFCRAHGFSGVDVDWEHPKGAGQLANYKLLLQQVGRLFHDQGLKVSVALPGWLLLDASAYRAIDRVHLMCYDGAGRHATLEFVRGELKKLLDSGAPAEKILLGIPFYGRHIETRRALTYAEIMKKYQPAAEIDEVDGIYFNGARTVARKVQLARDQKLAGVMVWEVAQDVAGDGSLLKAMSEEIKRGS